MTDAAAEIREALKDPETRRELRAICRAVAILERSPGKAMPDAVDEAVEEIQAEDAERRKRAEWRVQIRESFRGQVPAHVPMPNLHPEQR